MFPGHKLTSRSSPDMILAPNRIETMRPIHWSDQTCRERPSNHENHLPKICALICFFSTTKYHFRFNENRKFHELSHVDFNSSIDAKVIDIKLSGLNWISPFNENPNVEINLAKNAKKILMADKRNKMLITVCGALVLSWHLLLLWRLLTHFYFLHPINPEISLVLHVSAKLK